MALTPDRPQGTIPAWSNSHRENRQLSSCSSHVPKPLPQPYPAKSAKSHGTAEPVSAQINQHSHKIMVQIFFLTKCISISTGCKGIESQNAFMIVQSEDKALLGIHQLLLNLME